jgi:ABC-2 type transport system ATP-binding protein
VPPSEQKERYEQLLRFTGLSPFTSRLAGRLSGGMKQKLGLACTLLSQPRIFLLDEPGVGVDPLARRELVSMVREVLTPDRLVIWSTAYLDEAEMCDTVLLLNEGELLYSGPPKELSAQVNGRVFRIGSVKSERRRLIPMLWRHENIMDAVVQGSCLRVLVRDPEESIRSLLPEQATCDPAAPRFEDAFMGILGGIPHEGTFAAELFEDKASVREGGAPTVTAEHLTKRFGTFVAVNDISFAIKRGEIFGLLGPNGAGKSTTFKMLCGLTRPTLGKSAIAGLDFQSASGRAKAHLGYMAQKFSLYEDLTVLQNLRFFSGIYGLKGRRRGEAIGRVVKAFVLEPYLKTPSRDLPLGFKQRLSLACAIMHGPEVLFLDEPTSGVDPVTRREFWAAINNAAECGVTVLITTHFMDEAEYCDRIALIYQGRVVAQGSPDDLKSLAATNKDPLPTLEEAFIALIERENQS